MGSPRLLPLEAPPLPGGCRPRCALIGHKMVPPVGKSRQAEVAAGRWEQGGRQLGRANTVASLHRGRGHHGTEPKRTMTGYGFRKLYVSKSALLCMYVSLQGRDLHMQPAARCLRRAWPGPGSRAGTAGHLPDNDHR